MLRVAVGRMSLRILLGRSMKKTRSMSRLSLRGRSKRIKREGSKRMKLEPYRNQKITLRTRLRSMMSSNKDLRLLSVSSL